MKVTDWSSSLRVHLLPLTSIKARAVPQERVFLRLREPRSQRNHDHKIGRKKERSNFSRKHPRDAGLEWKSFGIDKRNTSRQFQVIIRVLVKAGDLFHIRKREAIRRKTGRSNWFSQPSEGPVHDSSVVADNSGKNVQPPSKLHNFAQTAFSEVEPGVLVFLIENQ
ncbi:hypothetical protein Tco_0655703 [Tanacetum coccineum]|uniref:Uncharacterized protein n=1 Tax=Tanacetum coccineum TaxID=301880 RepID=A0ABQ4X6Q7_9ASTR